MLHRNLTIADGINSPISWQVADEAARLALVIVAEDLGKIAYQIDTREFYFLSQIDPTIEWKAVLNTIPAVLAEGVVVADENDNYASVLDKNVESIFNYIGQNLEVIAAGKVDVETFTENVQAAISDFLEAGSNITFDITTTPGKLIINGAAGGGGSGAGITVSDVAPASPTNGMGWFNTTTGAFLVYVVEDATSEWVEIISGQIYSQYLSGYAAFHAIGNVAQLLAANTYTKININSSEEYDPDNCFDLPNSKFIAPVTGVYEFIVRVIRSNTGESINYIFAL